jgi:flagellar biosynthesis protein FlhB
MNILKFLAEFKVYYLQAGHYISIANFLMLLMSVKQLYNINVSAFVVIPVGFISMFIIGFIDYNFISPHYIKHINKKNDIKKDVEEIKQLLKK